MKTGDRLGPFTLGEKLGRGGTGTVFEATRDGARFAVKLLAMGDGSAAARFARERVLLARVEHPNVVKLVDAGVAGDACWLAMPRVAGETLRTRLARGPLSRAELARAGRELVSALGAIHAAGILHRDLTPSNLMFEEVRPGSRLIVLDFGLAKLVGDATVTRSRGIRLSLAYAPPERFRGEPQEVASDLYQAGLVLFEMATGRPAFPADDPSKLATAHLMAPAPSAKKANPDLPPLFDRVIERCLRKAPRERYATAAALEDDLTFLLPG